MEGAEVPLEPEGQLIVEAHHRGAVPAVAALEPLQQRLVPLQQPLALLGGIPQAVCRVKAQPRFRCTPAQPPEPSRTPGIVAFQNGGHPAVAGGGKVGHEDAGARMVIRQNRRGLGIVAAVQVDQGDAACFDFSQQLLLEAPQHIGDGLQDDPHGTLAQELLQVLSLPVPPAAGFQAGKGEPRLDGGLAGIPHQGGGEIFLLVGEHQGDLAAGSAGGLGGIGAAALAAEDQALFLQHLQGGADGLAAAGILPAQLGLGGQLLSALRTPAQPVLQLPGNDEILGSHGGLLSICQTDRYQFLAEWTIYAGRSICVTTRDALRRERN